MTQTIDSGEPGHGAGEPSPRVRRILDEAREMLRESGWGGVSMRRLATRIGVKAPSLYKHISGKEELFRLLLEEMLVALADRLQEACDAEPTAASVLAAYREQAVADPHGYRLIARTKIVDVTEPDALDRRIRAPFVAVTGDEHRGLALWAFAHGLVTAELVQDSGVDLDGVWSAGAAAFQHSMPAGAEPPRVDWAAAYDEEPDEGPVR